ncbi:MAG: hypothetical protein CMK49_00255 [Prochlorococcus sp. SP3034]|nr:hypothetical protein [Prochlorococcus sp. SP3034]|tara:strand:- start:8158 stop:8715 length:558 start_codon:yes stop_codon:yes gene_type:complete
MSYSLNSTLLLTILLFIGLFFFLRASSKDRTTTVEVSSSKQPVEVLNLICNWLNLRGWKQIGGDTDKQLLIFKGKVISSKFLAIFLSILGGLGSCSLGLVIVQLYPKLNWWPILLGFIGGPLSGIIYYQKSRREETFEFRLVDTEGNKRTNLRLRAHRDELISLETELKDKLSLESDGSLFKTPI